TELKARLRKLAERGRADVPLLVLMCEFGRTVLNPDFRRILEGEVVAGGLPPVYVLEGGAANLIPTALQEEDLRLQNLEQNCRRRSLGQRLFYGVAGPLAFQHLGQMGVRPEDFKHYPSLLLDPSEATRADPNADLSIVQVRGKDIAATLTYVIFSRN